MEYIQHVRKTDLARNTSRIIRGVQRGQTVLVENHGQVEAAIMDIIDYRILRALTLYYTRPPKISPQGLGAQALQNLAGPQERYDLVLAHYLAGTISLGRTAELLELHPLELQTRFVRLDVPLNLGPKDNQDAKAEVDAARNF
jgi:predicted HTH domain antitoxin/antitoxin (DNA-binding transcriptional repressor) of toxin-antitoxin stability system